MPRRRDPDGRSRHYKKWPRTDFLQVGLGCSQPGVLQTAGEHREGPGRGYTSSGPSEPTKGADVGPQMAQINVCTWLSCEVGRAVGGPAALPVFPWTTETQSGSIRPHSEPAGRAIKLWNPPIPIPYFGNGILWR